jgi:uncharacterized membrane protein
VAEAAEEVAAEVASARRLLAAVVAAAIALAAATAARAEFRDYLLGPADVVVQIEPDGSLSVRESIEFSFLGTFTGAYRDIPIRKGESIDRISVSDTGPAEGITNYRPGASAKLGSSGAPDTFGVARLKDRVRIVWHFSSNSLRTFFISYRFRGLAVAYHDVVDVDMNVWGAQWPRDVSSLTATIRQPDQPDGSFLTPLRVWGHPAAVNGNVARMPGAAVLTAANVPSHQFVELHTVFPRAILRSTGGAKVVTGDGLARIVGKEHKALSDYEHGRNEVRNALNHLLVTIPILILLALGPALLLLLAVWFFYGREHRTGYDRQYEEEPPTDLKPALVLPLINEAKSPASISLAFTATLFDLIRRGVYKATPTTTKVSGKDVTDLQLAKGTHDTLAEFETPVAEIVDSALADGPVPLTALSDHFMKERATNATRFMQFSGGLSLQIAAKKWYAAGSGGKILGWSIPAFIVAGIALLVVSINGFNSTAPLWSDVLMLAFGLACFPNAVVAAIGATRVKLWRRRTLDAEKEAERWEAFRRYLKDFPRLKDAPAATLGLWESYLVYGIAFGIAEQVLKAAHLYMPPELHQQSTVYWISSSPDLGSGATSLGISSLASDLESALTPISTSSSSSSSSSSFSDFGGSFSSSGGGGGGGGGGGAW